MARHPILTDEEILDRARAFFVEHGYAARTKQIAAAVGLTWGAIAPRFGGKQALFTQAMGEPARVHDEQPCQARDSTDLAGVLQRLRIHLWDRWPQRLQYRLAATAAGHDSEPEALVRRLTATLEAHAHSGSIRSDMSAEALARVVLALLTGEVAQRFVARERTLPSDPAAIDGVVRLLSQPGRRASQLSSTTFLDTP
jgi:AcrR family transcriptional regulator